MTERALSFPTDARPMTDISDQDLGAAPLPATPQDPNMHTHYTDDNRRPFTLPLRPSSPKPRTEPQDEVDVMGKSVKSPKPSKKLEEAKVAASANEADDESTRRQSNWLKRFKSDDGVGTEPEPEEIPRYRGCCEDLKQKLLDGDGILVGDNGGCGSDFSSFREAFVAAGPVMDYRPLFNDFEKSVASDDYGRIAAKNGKLGPAIFPSGANEAEDWPHFIIKFRVITCLDNSVSEHKDETIFLAPNFIQSYPERAPGQGNGPDPDGEEELPPKPWSWFTLHETIWETARSRYTEDNVTVDFLCVPHGRIYRIGMLSRSDVPWQSLRLWKIRGFDLKEVHGSIGSYEAAFDSFEAAVASRRISLNHVWAQRLLASYRSAGDHPAVIFRYLQTAPPDSLSRVHGVTPPQVDPVFFVPEARSKPAGRAGSSVPPPDPCFVAFGARARGWIEANYKETDVSKVYSWLNDGSSLCFTVFVSLHSA